MPSGDSRDHLDHHDDLVAGTVVRRAPDRLQQLAVRLAAGRNEGQTRHLGDPRSRNSLLTQVRLRVLGGLLVLDRPLIDLIDVTRITSNTLTPIRSMPVAERSMNF